MTLPQIRGTSIADGTLLLADFTTGEFVATATASKGVLRDANGDAAFRAVTGTLAPASGDSLCNKTYVDSIAGGLDPAYFKPACKAKSIAALPAYTRTANVIEADANGVWDAATYTDGVAQVIGERFFLTHGAAPADNGIYTWTTIGAAGAKAKLTRAADMDADAECAWGSYTLVTAGTAYAQTGWLSAGTGAITLNTTPINYVQYSPATNVLAGTALATVGSTLNHASVLTDALGAAGTYPLATVVLNAQGHATGATKHHFHNSSGILGLGDLTFDTGAGAGLLPDAVDPTKPACADIWLEGIRLRQYNAGGPDVSIAMGTGIATLTTAGAAGQTWEFRGLVIG
jgi:hypothetical protein